jgi:secretion-regulating guanine nucleotide exchange factor
LNVTESGQLYIWGRALVGEHDDDQPQAAFPSLSISQVALGWHHALVKSGTRLFHIDRTMFSITSFRSLKSSIPGGELYTIGAYRHQKRDRAESENAAVRQQNLTTSSTHHGTPHNL